MNVKVALRVGIVCTFKHFQAMLAITLPTSSDQEDNGYNPHGVMALTADQHHQS